MPSAFAYPEPVEDSDATLVAIDMQLLPFVLGAVGNLQDRKYWQSDEDWYRASEAISAFLECSMVTCVGDLLESQKQLYRLIDSGLNGTVYTADGDPVVISPEIGAVPPTESILPGLIARVDHMEVMLDALPGILDPGWFGYGGSKATIADVVRSLRIGSESQSTETIDSLQEILGAGADIGSIGELIAELFTGSVSAVEEGGIFVLLAAATVGTLTVLGAVAQNQILQMTQISRLINSLDGGGGTGPNDNILMALRGTTEASETRNVVDSIVAALALVSVDNPDVLAKLEEIRVLLT